MLLTLHAVNVFQMFSKKYANSRKLSAFFFEAPANCGFYGGRK